MAKRFTDTEKWKKKFIRGLNAPYKLLWFYILDDCDHAGIWHTDFEVASIRIGSNIDSLDAELFFKDQIISFDDNEKWFIPSFIRFQYGELNENNRAHNSVIQILKRYDLLKYINDENKHHTSTLKDAKDKDKEKDKLKDIETRKKLFSAKVIIEAKDKYDKSMINDFIEYWSEHGENDRKMRFEKEKVFGISRRLSTWHKRSYKKDDQKLLDDYGHEANEFKL